MATSTGNPDQKSNGSLLVWVVDSSKQPLPQARLRIAVRQAARSDAAYRDVPLADGHGEVQVPGSGTVILEAEAAGSEKESLSIRLRGGVQQVVIGLRTAGELSYDQGDSRFAVKPQPRGYLLSARGKDAARQIASLFDEFGLRGSPVPVAGLDVASSDAPDEVALQFDADPPQAAALLGQMRQRGLAVDVARPLSHGNHPPTGLTGELVVSFTSDTKRDEVERIAARLGYQVARHIHHAGNAFLFIKAGPPEYEVLADAQRLSEEARVIYVEPNLLMFLRNDVYVPADPLWPNVPHLPLINADDVWDRLDNVAVALRGGSPAITIAVIDLDGITPNHPDLTANLTDGTSKLVVSMNFAAAPIAAQTVAGLTGDHGTQCAGSATAAFDNQGLPGVAPNCHLIGARIPGAGTALAMADLYMWVGGFMNGSTAAGFPAAAPARAADVISSSLGANGAALANVVRDCFDFLTAFGRNGRGCVLCFSLGNNGYFDYTAAAGAFFRAWPTYEKTIGVGASISTAPTNPVTSFHEDPTGATAGIATQVDRRALYSPFGATALRKPDLVAPSHTSYSAGGGARFDPITSCVRVGTGAIDGCNPGTCNDYAATFGGTSHATPVVAGAAALILSARPELSWVQVRDVLRRTSVKIDAANANAIGQWQDLDADGAIDYSRWYGYGRLDVDAAVAVVLDPALLLADCYVRENLADTGTVPSPGWHAESPDIWVRPTNDAIPVLDWLDPPPHANPIRTHDNWVYCRVKNRGTAPASAIYLRASVTHYPGFEFRYPQEFRPSTNVGAALPTPLTPGTYLIGETRIDNLPVNDNVVVKMTWPQALVPPASVVMGGTTVFWHPCLLLEVSPHDGPMIDASVTAVRGSNNLAHRNIAIDDSDSDSDSGWTGIVAGSLDRFGVRGLVLDGSRLSGARGVRLRFADAKTNKMFADAALRFRQTLPNDSTGSDGLLCRLFAFLARLFGCRVPHGAVKVDISVAGDEVRIAGLAQRLEIPLMLAPKQLEPMMVALAAGTGGEVRLTQLRGDGQYSAGYAVRRVAA